jgi:hypothetical protein
LKIVNGWIDTAVEIDYGAKSMSRNGWKPMYICLHGTAGGSSAQAIATYFRDSDVEASAHIVIGQDGTVVQGISMEVAAWGNGVFTAGHKSWLPDANPNYYTISIEHVKSATDNSNQLTDAQKRASFQVIDCICNAYGILRRAGDARGGLISHADIDPVNRSRCPGPYPWDELYKYLNSGGEQQMAEVRINVGIGARFKDMGGGRWLLIGSNPAIYLRGHMRQAFCYYEGIFGLPKDNEIPLDNEGSTVQPFERVLAVYDPKHKFDNPPRVDGSGAPADIYLMHIDGGDGQKRVAKPLTDALNKTIADKQAQIDALQHQLSTTENLEKEALQQQLQDALDAKDKLVNLYKQFSSEIAAAIS